MDKSFKRAIQSDSAGEGLGEIVHLHDEGWKILLMIFSLAFILQHYLTPVELMNLQFSLIHSLNMVASNWNALQIFW